MFFGMFHHILFPEGPVRKILVVRSGPEGPQFAQVRWYTTKYEIASYFFKSCNSKATFFQIYFCSSECRNFSNSMLTISFNLLLRFELIRKVENIFKNSWNNHIKIRLLIFRFFRTPKLIFWNKMENYFKHLNLWKRIWKIKLVN